jgi:hypothetical protein
LDSNSDLAEIAALWTNLSPTVRHCVMTLVRSIGGHDAQR